MFFPFFSKFAFRCKTPTFAWMGLLHGAGILRLLELKAPELQKLDASKANDLEVPLEKRKGI